MQIPHHLLFFNVEVILIFITEFKLTFETHKTHKDLKHLKIIFNI